MAPDLIVTSAGPVRVLPAPPPPWWRRILTALHLPGGIVPSQPPTIVSAAFTGGPYLAGSGVTMTIAVVAKSLNESTANLTVPLVLADVALPSQTTTVDVTGVLESFNNLAASISDPARTWKAGVPVFDPDTGAWSCDLTAPA